MKRKIVILFVFIFLLFFTSYLQFKIDNSRVAAGQVPVFAVPVISYDDGGSIIYYGNGFEICRWKQLTGRNGVYETGSEGHWLIGFVKKPSVKLTKTKT